MKKSILLLCAIFFIAFQAHSNNVQMTNVSIINGGAGNIKVKFDLSWDNSWRTNVGPANYDGVWVIFKYKQQGMKWNHLNLTGIGNSTPSGFSIFQNSGSPKIGAMIFRSAANLGIGTVTVANIELGVANNLPYDIDIRGFALEMVNVPAPTVTRPFFGDGDGTNESTNALHYADNTATTNSTLPIRCDANSLDDGELEVDGMYIYSNDTIQLTNPIGPLEPFPTMKEVWCMKYEISQASYRDFLNTLDSLQQDTRTVFPPTSPIGTRVLTASAISRSYIEIVVPASANTPAIYGCDANNNNIFDESADGEFVACNFLLWQDVAAFLDWSGLAPMSEIQYERMCRGSSSAGANAAILGEFAWGSTSIANATYTIGGLGSANEIVTNLSPNIGNAVYANTFTTPLRSGIFANATSTRTTSGATFYGIMEMSGNLQEYCISIGNVAGRSCEYVPNGNGALSPLGNAQLPLGGAGYWPGMDGNITLSSAQSCTSFCEVNSVAGIRLRGGGNSNASSVLSVSDRSSTFQPTARGADRGGRGVLQIR